MWSQNFNNYFITLKCFYTCLFCSRGGKYNKKKVKKGRRDERGAPVASGDLEVSRDYPGDPVYRTQDMLIWHQSKNFCFVLIILICS